ncbi:hypothetical protein AVEN_267685-1 [Araneus ventricosus]|uniref:RNase H type-1 domain-containing protein n=1 Tax=Araneus ventricosus TaxID=182803 RepID=A0A4Y2N3W1_ARAVE|nr:hypothetical protein AVEN_267685-1 [Araneus ventricosus]
MLRNKYIVYTDSKSAIDALEALSISSHPLVTKCAELSNYLIEKEVTNIAICWISGHCGIKENERADHAAKTAFLMKENFVPLVDAQRTAENLIIGSWKDIWEQQTSNELHEFHPCLEPLKLAGLNRRKVVISPQDGPYPLYTRVLIVFGTTTRVPAVPKPINGKAYFN